MSPSAWSRFLRFYPPAWRDRYGEEFIALLEDDFATARPPLKAIGSIVYNGLRERARYGGLVGDRLPPTLQVRAALMVVATGWAAMVAAGGSFAKMSEHFDAGLASPAARHAPDFLYAAVELLAAIGSFAVSVGVLLAIPTFARYLRSGGWPILRSRAKRAVTVTALTALATIALVGWAHRLSDTQRNGGSLGYSILFLLWSALGVGCLALWTMFGIAIGTKLTFSKSILAIEAALAFLVSLCVTGILASALAWACLIAQRYPAFLGVRSPLLSVRLDGTLILMLAATAVSWLGVARMVRKWPLLLSAQAISGGS